MRAPGVVVLTPALGDDPGLGEAVEQLAVQELVAQLGVEPLAVAVLPRAAKLDERRFRADRNDPLPHGLGDALGPLSERTWPGAPRRMKRLDSTSVMSVALSSRSIRIEMHSRVIYSITPAQTQNVCREHAELPATMGAILDDQKGRDANS